MRLPAFLLFLLLAGCVGEAPAAQEDVAPAAVPATPELEPVVQELRGHATASAASRIAHVDPATEERVAPIQREGFILDIVAVPTMLQIEVEWDGAVPGEMVPMVNVPTSQQGKVVDYVGEWSATGLTCMRLPVDELTPERISVMAHSRNAANVDFTLRVTTLGGETHLLDAPHMEVERTDPVEGTVLPCEDAL